MTALKALRRVRLQIKDLADVADRASPKTLHMMGRIRGYRLAVALIDGEIALLKEKGAK